MLRVTCFQVVLYKLKISKLYHCKCSRLELWRGERTWTAPHPLRSGLGRLESTGVALLTICENQAKPGKKKNPANATAEAGYWNCGHVEEGRCTRLSRLTQQRVRSIPWLFLVCLQCRAGLQAGPQSTPSPSAPTGRSPSPGKVWQVWDLCRVTLLFVWGCHVATKGRKTFFLFKQT